jgi:hypothetical protein
MRRRSLIKAVVAAVGVFALIGAASCGSGSDRADPAASTNASKLRTQSIRSGSVEVKIQPLAVNDRGATFKVSFDTHSFDLAFDVTRAARLEVGGETWTAQRWSGDGPGGHHRSGELRFAADGPASGVVRLSISGLPEPVVATWRLAS